VPWRRRSTREIHFGARWRWGDIEDVFAGFGAFGYPLTDEPDEADLWLMNTYLSLIFLIYFLFCIYILLP
jgi:hypothetical protein